MSPPRTRVRVVVTGRVQGVWFRDSCRERAHAEAVAGWVRNRADGAVEAEFEGASAAVERLVAWCRDGPPRARVDHVAVEALPPVGDHAFHVR
ncbi:MAG TPA: acylphosphatase [Acidimicrobiia bacterium]|nr:acylphosphatase [Acidimicrobiia bacterium]